nr:valine--tRNA ligase [Deltaproteobacteria bacterium]
TPVEVVVRSDDATIRESLSRVRESAAFLGRMKSLTVLDADGQLPKESAVAVVDGVEIGLPLAGLVDLDEERKRLAKEIAKKTKELSGLDRKLSNEAFLAKAPADVVERERERQGQLRDSLSKQQAFLDRLS